MAILRTERAMIRAMCGVKLLDRRNCEELMDNLGIKESFDRMAKASSLRWCSHVLRKEDKKEDSLPQRSNHIREQFLHLLLCPLFKLL